MIYLVVNIILLIITSIVIFIRKDNKKINNKTIDKNYTKIVIILFLLVVLTSIYKLGLVPRGIHVDEAGMFYDAKLLAKYGYDRYLKKMPVYLINFGGGQSAMYAYLTALLIKIFGNKLILMRVPAVTFRIISFISAYFLIQNEKDKLKRIIFLFLLTIVPYFIMQSRWGLDCNLLVSFMTISITLFINSIIKKNQILLFLSGLFFGLSLYTYALSYIIIPLFLLITLIYLLRIKSINIKEIIIFCIPLFILAIPLILMILINNGIIKEINSFITIPKLPFYRGSEISIKNILPNIRIFFAILTFDKIFFGENLIYNSLPYFGTLYYMSIPFVIIGLVELYDEIKKDLKDKKISINIIMFIWFISVIICMLLIVRSNINKANAIFIPLLYFTALGIISISKKNGKTLKIIMALYITNYLIFFNYYYFKYSEEYANQPYFGAYYLETLDYAKSSPKKIIYVDPSITNETYIYILMREDVSYNSNIIKTDNKIYIIGTPITIDDNTLYITKSKDKHTNYKQIGDIYIINK